MMIYLKDRSLDSKDYNLSSKGFYLFVKKAAQRDPELLKYEATESLTRSFKTQRGG
jgi:hypothetical protein